MYWTLEMTAEEAKDVVMNIKGKVPSLREEQLRFALSTNSVEAFVNEYIIKGDGAPIGYKKDVNNKNTQIAKENGHLFYFYKEYCLNRDLVTVSHNDFAKLLVEAAESKGLKCNKVRKRNGTYISGIALDPVLFSAEYITGQIDKKAKIKGAVVSGENGSDVGGVECIEIQAYPITYISPKPGKAHHSLTPDLDENYILLFEETPLKKILNDASMVIPKAAPGLIFDQCIEKVKLRDDKFLDTLRSSIGLSIGKLEKTGMISCDMQSMGDSPRYMPLDTKYAVNNYKKPVARLGLQLMALEASKMGYTILDLDLKSCYASTILGLWPQEVTSLKAAVEKGSIWIYIEEEFDEWERKDAYVKTYVKAAVYAGCFGGGKVGLKNTVLETKRKELGLKPADFKESSLYKEFVEEAEIIGALAAQSSVYKCFRSVAIYFKKLYVNQTVVGPSGYVLVVDEENYRSQYSNYLQDFERAIKCEFCLRLVKAFPGTEVLLDLHDGITVAVPTERLEEIELFLISETKEIGYGLGLKHDQVMEIAESSVSLLKDFNLGE